MKMDLEEFKLWYKEQYGVKPSEKLIERFNQLNAEKPIEETKNETKIKRK